MSKVLVIEDDEQNHILMDSVLTSMGHEALHARNGQEGIELADTHRPDLILLDMRLPLMNGWEVATALKSNEELQHIPVIAVSVLINTADKMRALEAGCDGFISKPYSLNGIRSCIKQYLD